MDEHANLNAPNDLQTATEPVPPPPEETLRDALARLDTPCRVTESGGRIRVAPEEHGHGAFVPACTPENLGDASFRRDHRIRYAYLAGAMANGIGSVEIVETLARAGMLGFFGAAGLGLDRIERAIDRLGSNLGELPYGFNLIHSPTEPDLEAAVADLYVRRKVKRVEASAYLNLSLPLVRYRVHGIHRDRDGRIVTPNRVIAKASRVEVATRFFSPPPRRHLEALVSRGEITSEQAELAARIPVAEDLTAEADSGGHTDNRPLIALLPTLLALRDRLQAQHAYDRPLRVGAAGGIATPVAAAAAFAMGAAWILTGSIHQACRESGSSDAVRRLLAEAEQADVTMAPAADMFEMGVKVQVLKRGTMFPMRALRLFELYRNHDSLESLPAAERETLQKRWFRASFEDIWAETRRFFETRDPARIERAEADPRKKMALVFRWYLGQTSRWANRGEPSRQMDYQVWCGPAMGAFNEWVRGSFLDGPENRGVSTVALNILHGAAYLFRLNVLRQQGVTIPPGLDRVEPRRPADLEQRRSFDEGNPS
jgi:PfaD family protein